ncbi:MAG: WG repeat-containing protein [Deltaproteobacteria bacterium]|nr:WG repeat-containing protein [Deltaproteobacteria bacterium]
MQRLSWFYLGAAGEVRIPAEFVTANDFEEHAPVARVADATGKMGLLGVDGSPVLAPTYDHIAAALEADAPFRTNDGAWLDGSKINGGKWGFVRSDGSVVVEPTYDFAYDFEEGLATVEIKGTGYGCIDRNGQVVVQPQYAFMSHHRNGLAFFSDGTKEGYLDLKGGVVIAPQFDEATNFDGGMAKVKVGERFGLIGPDGSWISEPKWERMGTVRHGTVWAVGDGKVMVLNAQGGVFGPFQDARLQLMGEISHVPVKDGETWGFIDVQGNRIAGGFGDVWAYSGGSARVKDAQGKLGYIDERGQLVIGHHFEDGLNYVGDTTSVKHEGKWGVIDRQGQVSIPFEYDSPIQVREGVGRVEKDGRFGFAKLGGELVRAIDLDAAGVHRHGLAPALMAERVSEFTGTIEGVHQLPPDGMQGPIFSTDENRHVVVVAGWERELTITEELLVTRIVDTWERSVRVKAGGKIYTEARWISPISLYLRVQDDVADARIEVSTLISDLRAAKLPIFELLFAQWGVAANSPNGVMSAVPDPRMPLFQANFADFPEYWSACWADDAVAPATENLFYLKGAIVDQQSMDIKALEERHAPIFVPGAKVCFGALGNQGEQYIPNDGRSAEVETAVRNALAERWKSVWIKPGLERFVPRIFIRDGGDGLERLTYDGRVGYCFAITCSDLLHWHSKSRMRYREQELMEAMFEATKAANLSPTILWNRYSNPIPMLPMSTPNVVVIQLWEKEKGGIDAGGPAPAPSGGNPSGGGDAGRYGR